MISKSAWDEMLTTPSRFSAWATILMEGRDEKDLGVLAASSEATSPAAGYLALKAESYATPGAQLSAVVADLSEKTSEVDTFIGFADALVADYRAVSDPAHATIGVSALERPQDMLKSDRHIVELAVAELNSQKTTYQAVERRLKEDAPNLDTSSLSRALDAFGARIKRLSALGDTMVVARS